MTLGAEIARLRMEKGLRQKDLAELLQVSQANVARWENNMNHPRKKVFQRLADALGVGLEALVAADDRDGGGRLLQENDPELSEMVAQLHRLGARDRDVLKAVIDAMLTKAEMHQVLERKPKTAAAASERLPPDPKQRPRVRAKRLLQVAELDEAPKSRAVSGAVGPPRPRPRPRVKLG